MRDCKAFEYIRTARDIARDKGIHASFFLHIENSNLIRIGNSSVSLNTSEHLIRLDVSVQIGRKSGHHTQMGSIESVDSVLRALDIAHDKAVDAFERHYQPYLAGPEENISFDSQYDRRVEELNTDYKVDFFKKIIESTGKEYNYSGSWSSGSVERFLISTKNDYEAWHLGTDQQFIMVLKHPAQKWELKSDMSGWRLEDLKTEEAINYFKKLLPIYENNDGYKVEPGKYTVALGPGAISEIIFASTEIAFNGQAYEEKQSWLCNNKPGDKIAQDFITIVDDPDSDLVFGLKFDDAGKLRKRFPLVENGVFNGIMYDDVTAARYSKEMTGHTLLYVNNAVMEAGKDDSDMLKAVKDLGKVIYIPDLHYVGIVSPTKGILTGSSRYNAVLIENGVMKAPLFSTRLTERIGFILNNIIKMSSESVSFNMSNTYDRRSPFAIEMPRYIVVKEVALTDSADSF